MLSAEAKHKQKARTAQVAALLLRRQLVLEVHARGAGLDHGLRENIEGCQHLGSRQTSMGKAR